jgi:hypothetical protein
MKKFLLVLFAFAFASTHAFHEAKAISVAPIASSVVGMTAAGALSYFSEQGVLTPARHALTTLGLCAITEAAAYSCQLDPVAQISLTAVMAVVYGIFRPIIRHQAWKNSHFGMLVKDQNLSSLLKNTKIYLDLIDKNKAAGNNEKIERFYKTMWDGPASDNSKGEIFWLRQLYTNEKSALKELKKAQVAALAIKDEENRLRGLFDIQEKELNELFDERIAVTQRLIALLEERVKAA